MERPADRLMGRGVQTDWEAEGPAKDLGPLGRQPDWRCCQVILDFFSGTDVGRLVPTEEDAVEVAEWEHRECRDREG